MRVLNSSPFFRTSIALAVLLASIVPAVSYGAGPSQPSAGATSIQISGQDGKKSWKISDVTISASGPSETELRLQIDQEAEIPLSGTYTYEKDGKHRATVKAVDNKGKVVAQSSKAFKLDKTKPELQAQAAGMEGENGWLITDVEVSIGAKDETSKLARVDFAVDSDKLQPYKGPVKVTEEGTHSVIAEAEDNAGNIEKVEQPFYIDKTKPVIADVYVQDEYYWDQEFPIDFTTTDAVSGVASITATINGRAVTNGNTYRFTEPGWHTYRIEVKDVAGWKAVYETKFEVYIPAKITFNPDSLQLVHGSGMATNFIELPAPFAPEKINFSTVQTNWHVVHIQDPQYGYVQSPIGDSDENGIPDLMLKYERESLVDVIPPGEEWDGSTQGEEKWSHTTITMFGDWDIYHFKGYDGILVWNEGYTPPPPDVTPPSVSMNPTDGATNVSVDVTPVLTFSEPVISMEKTELTDSKVKELIHLTDEKGQLVPFTANWMKNTASIQINPSIRLPGQTLYVVELPANSATDAVYNGNEALRASFTTEDFPIIIPPPLPLPVIEIEPDEPETPPTEPDSPPPNPPNPPNPPKPPKPRAQQQIERNLAAMATIYSATDEEMVVQEVRNVINSLADFMQSDEESVASKFDVMDSTVSTVMVAMVHEMEEGVVSSSQVADSTNEILQEVYQTAIADLNSADREEKEKATTAMSSLLEKVLSRLDKKDLDEDLADSVDANLHGLLDKQSVVQVEQDEEITDLSDELEDIDEKTETFTKLLGKHASSINLKKKVRFEVQNSKEIRFIIAKEATGQIESKGFSVVVQDEDKLGMEIPARLLKKLKKKRLEVSIEPSGRDTETDSQIFAFTLQANDKPVTTFGTSEVNVILPFHDEEVKRLLPFYYDEKSKKWKAVKSRRGKTAQVTMLDGVVTFATPHFTTFMVAEAKIERITVSQKKLRLEPGEQKQLTVKGYVNDETVQDITQAELGTTYESSNPAIAVVDENGLIQVSEEAKRGDKVTITVENSGKTATITIFITD